MVPSFHSPPSPANFGALVLRLEPDTVTTTLGAVVPSRFDLVLPDLIKWEGEKRSTAQRASERGRGRWRWRWRWRWLGSAGVRNIPGPTARDGTSIRSRASDWCRQAGRVSERAQGKQPALPLLCSHFCPISVSSALTVADYRSARLSVANKVGRLFPDTCSSNSNSDKRMADVPQTLFM